MLESVSEIRKKVRPYKYLPKEGKDIDVEGLITKLRADEQFSRFSDAQLYEYAYGLMAQRQNEIFNYGLKGLATNIKNGKPNDPMWSQYTYQEILAMEENGVVVPEDFTEWAHAMQDADTMSYQIEDETDDSNAFENLDAENNNITKSEIQKKAQAFASKAEAQEALLKDETDKTKPLSAEVETKQNEIAKAQKLSLDKMADMTTEWNALDKKFQSGEELSSAEQKRYKELGTLLNGQQNEIIAKAETLNSDIDELMSQMDKVSSLVNTNNRIGDELSDIGLRLAGLEGGDKKAFLPNYKNSGITGLTANFYYAALGNNMSAETLQVNTRLYFDTMDVQHKLNANVTLSEMAAKQTVEVKDVSKTASVQNPEQDTNSQTQSTNQTPKPPQVPADGEEVPETDAVVTESETTSVQEADSAAAADSAAETAPSTDTNEITSTTDAEDAEAAEIRAYVEDCASKNEEMLQAEEAIQPIKEEVEKIKKTQKQEDAKLEKEIKDALKEYNVLLKKVQAGNDFTKKDQAKFEQLGKLLGEQNGKYIVQMQEKVDTLNGFSETLDRDIQLTVENAQYGEQSAEAGRDYAKKTIGDPKELMNRIPFWVVLSEEDIKNLLYGKAGESVARDAIDGGEALAANSQASNERLSKSLPLSAFAEDYSGVLTEKITNTNKEVKTINHDFKEAFKKNAETKQAESSSQPDSEVPENLEGTNNSNNTESNSGDKSSNDKVTEDDGKKVEKDGKEVKKDGDNAKKDGEKYAKDKKSTDAQIKKETANLKENERRIKAYTADTVKANKEMEEMAIEIDTLLQAQSAKPDEVPQEEPAQTPVQPIAAIGNAGIPAQSSKANVSMGSAVNSASSAPAAPKTNSSVSAGASSSNSDIAAKIQTISARSPQIQKRVTKNAANITTLQKSSVKKTKKLNKLYTAKNKSAQILAKKQEESVQKNEKLQGTITKIGYAFTGTKFAGQALMLMPWSAAAGLVMFTVGKYGEIACYVTNSAIDVANGNFAGALINVGAAALSFASGPIKLDAGTEAVKSAAKEGTKAVAEEGGKQAVEQGVQQAATQVAEQSTKQVVAASAEEIVKTPLQNAMKSSLQAAYAGVGDMMATTSKSVATEVAKSATKEALVNGGLQVAAGAAQTIGQKLEQKDSKVEEKKQRKLISYQEKKKRKSQLTKIQSSNKVSMNRGKKQS